MSKLKDIYDFLIKKPTNTMEVWDMLKDKKIHDKKYRPKNINSFESFKQEIKEIAQTHGKIGLQRFIKNGNASVRSGAMIPVITSNTDADLEGAASNPAPRSHQNNYTGMQGPSYQPQQQPQGLGIVEMGKLQNYDEVKHERDTLRQKLEALNKENQKLELENKMYELKTQSSSKFDKLFENPEALQAIVGALGQGIGQFMNKQGNTANTNANAGLNAPKLSKLKQMLIADLVKLDPSDTVVQRLAFTLKTYIDNPSHELINLIEKYYQDATRNNQNNS